MAKLVLILVAALAIGTSTSARADDRTDDAQIAAVGGGVRNPWRSPYKTAFMGPATEPVR